MTESEELSRQQRLGLAIRTARKEIPLAQQMLADRIGSSQSYISLLEKGKVDQPGIRLLTRIAHELNINADDLLREAGWPDLDAYMQELQEAHEALAGLSGKRIEIVELLSDLPEDEAEKIWSYANYLHEERARYDVDGPAEILDEDWRELLRLAPKLPKETARTFVSMARLMVPAVEEDAQPEESAG